MHYLLHFFLMLPLPTPLYTLCCTLSTLSPPLLISLSLLLLLLFLRFIFVSHPTFFSWESSELWRRWQKVLQIWSFSKKMHWSLKNKVVFKYRRIVSHKPIILNKQFLYFSLFSVVELSLLYLYIPLNFWMQYMYITLYLEVFVVLNEIVINPLSAVGASRCRTHF